MKATMKFMCVSVLTVFIICGGLASTSPAAEKEVLIAGIFPLTGPVSDYAAPGLVAMEDYFAYVNKQGGVDGVKIKLKYEDNRYKVPEAISIYKKFLPQKPVAFTLWNSSGAHEALKSFFEADKIPAMSIAMSDPQFYPPGWILADSCGYGDQHAAFFNWFRSELKEKRKVKVGWIGWNSPYGRAGYEEMKKYVATRGGEVVGIEYTTYAPSTVMPQLLRLKKKKADYIWINAYNATIDVVMKELSRGGINIPLVGNSNEPTDGQMITSGPDAEGYIGYHGWYSHDFEENLPQDFLDLMKKVGTRRGRAKTHWLTYSRGMSMAMVYTEALRMAIQKVGYEGLSGDALMNHGFMAMKGYRTPLSKMPNGLDNKDDRRLNPYGRFYKVKGGKSVPLSGWLKAPWLKKEVEG